MHGVRHVNRVRAKVLNTDTYEYWKHLQVHKIQQKDVRVEKLYQKDGLLAVYKPYGVPTHAGAKTRFSMVDFFPQLERECGLQCGSLDLANRLDQEVAGVLLLTYTREMAAHIAHLQRKHRIEKEYLTVLVGSLQRRTGKLVGDLHERYTPAHDQYKQEVVDTAITRRSTSTQYEILDNNGRECMLCSFTTRSGAKHQIRVHASHVLQCPILGDHKYHAGPHRGPQQLPLRLMQKLRMYGVSQANGRGVIRPWQRGLVPLHLFARRVLIPGLGNNGDGDVLIEADLPEYFYKTLIDCDLLLERDDEQDEARRKQEVRRYQQKESGGGEPSVPPRVEVPRVPMGPSPYNIDKEFVI